MAKAIRMIWPCWTHCKTKVAFDLNLRSIYSTKNDREERFEYLDGYQRQITDVLVKQYSNTDLNSFASYEEYTYDGFGNIRHKLFNDTQKGVWHDFTYGYTGKELEYVEGTTSLTSGTFKDDLLYDNNGNVTNLGNNELTYNGKSAVTRLARSNNSNYTLYEYDESSTRYYREANEYGRITKAYMVGSYERIERDGVIEHRHYIGENTLVLTTENGAQYTQHFVRDHIGSVVAIVDASGNLLERKRYTIFGEDILTDQRPTSIPQELGITEKGFTNHEHVSGFEFIHMGGRMYHPIIGRFMQADPYLQNPKAPVNYNRYAYVMNNPLGYTDPSGYKYADLVWGNVSNDSTSDEDSASGATENDSIDSSLNEKDDDAGTQNDNSSSSRNENQSDSENEDTPVETTSFWRRLITGFTTSKDTVQSGAKAVADDIYLDVEQVGEGVGLQEGSCRIPLACAAGNALQGTEFGVGTALGGSSATASAFRYASSADDLERAIQAGYRVVNDVPLGYLQQLTATKNAVIRFNGASKLLGVAGAVPSAAMFGINMAEGDYKAAGLNFTDLLMTAVGFAAPYGTGVSVVYFVGRFAVDYNTRE